MKLTALLVGLCLAATAVPAWEQTLLENPVDQRREDIRDERRQPQQGAGAHDQTGGKPASNMQENESDDSSRAARTSPQVRQDTGRLDPTAVNPGQAAGTQNR